MYPIVKRALDVVLSVVMLVLLAPLYALLAILIVVDSGKPILFRQTRIGLNGNDFCMLKFRSMVPNAQEKGTGTYSFAGDDRVTRIGGFMRKTSLDELPQLVNILRGEMSFVGPRPPVSGHFPEYEELRDEYKKRFAVRPGLTGLAQCSGRNELLWDEKIRLDNEYVDGLKCSGLALDLKIIGLTVKRVFSMTSVEENPDNMKKNEKILSQMVKSRKEGQ